MVRTSATLRDVQAGDKQTLRRTMRDVRRVIAADPADRRRRSRRIWDGIVDAAALGSRRAVLLYEALPTEPETAAWYAWCRDHGVAVFSPEVHGPDLRVAPGDVDPAVLDVVVVPGLAFTADGRRLGQGGGHYDRFLARLGAGCLTIGAAYAEQVVEDLPTEAHDVRLHMVVTDA